MKVTANPQESARKERTKELWTSFAVMRDNYRDAIGKAKQESCTNFCTDIEKGVEAARLEKLLSRNPEATLGALKLPGGAYSGSDEETLACLIGANFSGFKRSGDGGGATPHEYQKLPVAQLGSQRRLACEIATPEVVRWALKIFSPYKSPGPDGIYPVLIQRAGEPIVGPLVSLASVSLILKYVLMAWRGTRLVFIPKAGKNGYTLPKDFVLSASDLSY